MSIDVHFKSRSLCGLWIVSYSEGGSDSIIDNIEMDEIFKVVLHEIFRPYCNLLYYVRFPSL